MISRLASEVHHRLLQRERNPKVEEETGRRQEKEEGAEAERRRRTEDEEAEVPLRFQEEKQLTPLHDEIGCTPFDYSGLSFALTLIGDYDL